MREGDLDGDQEPIIRSMNESPPFFQLRIRVGHGAVLTDVGPVPVDVDSMAEKLCTKPLHPNLAIRHLRLLVLTVDGRTIAAVMGQTWSQALHQFAET